MGFLAASQAVVLRAVALAMLPPPPPDITRWCEENIVFDERSPMPGPFRISAFPFLRDIHEVLSPEHPAREVTVRGSAQWGKTVSVLQPTLGAWHAYAAMDSLVVHPTMSAATEWVKNKWLPMRRQAPALKRLFGDGRSGDNSDALFNQETVTRNGSLKVASSGSPADLTGTTRRLVIMDDLSKYEASDMGDPESLAVSRASAFEDAKIVRISTPLIDGACRISKAFARSDQRHFHVPCPHCGNRAPLTWENFKARIDPERLAAAHFTCEACGAVIGHQHKVAMVAAGVWVAHNPSGDHPGFHLWRAYVPQRDWASIAVEYAQVMGWTRLTTSSTSEVELRAEVSAATEQTFYNDVLGLPYAAASRGPDWTALRDRVEHASPDEQIGVGILPARGMILTAGVDCQQDRTEFHLVAHLEGFRRHVVEYRVIPHHIGDEECRKALDALLRASWRTGLGRRLAIDMLAIDGGTYTNDVWDWAKRHPWTRVIIVKGASTQNGPLMMPMRFERRADGQARKLQKRAFMVNVSQMKLEFYGWLTKDDPLVRGYCGFAAGLGDEYYRQISSEVRVLKRGKTGIVTSQWDLVESGRRNEALDTILYAEAAARRKGWGVMTQEGWERLADLHGSAPPEAQSDLFDASASSVAGLDRVAAPHVKVVAAPEAAPRKTKAADDWLGGRSEKRGDWI